MKSCMWTLLAVACIAVQAVSAGPIASVDAEKLSLFKTLSDIAGVTEELASEKARVTLLAPTNEAIEKFLSDMGLTAADLKEKPTLARHILGYHTILGVAASSEALFAKEKERVLETAAIPYDVTVRQAADGGVEVVDFQGNVARVTKANIGTGNHQIHVIDRVLYSGAYWNNFADVAKAMPNTFSTIAAAAEKAGLAEVLTAKDFSDTLFVPTNAAFEKAGITLEASKDQIASVLKYHVIPGDRSIPRGFKSGEAIKTLEGQAVKVEYKRGDLLNEGLVSVETYVVDANDKKALVIHPNVFIGKAEAHVIDSVLMPKAAAAAAATPTAAAAPAAAAATPASKPAAAAEVTATAAASTTASSSRTITIKKPFFTITIKHGRKMLQSEAQNYANEIALDSSEQAILNAVNSDADYSATAGAGFGSVANVQVNEHYGVHSSYYDAIGGSVNQASANAGGN